MSSSGHDAYGQAAGSGLREGRGRVGEKLTCEVPVGLVHYK